MRAWILWLVVIALGIIAIVSGAALYVSHLHRTIGLGGIGIGVVLAIIGLVGGLLGRRPAKIKEIGEEMKPVAAPRAPKGSYRKALIAVLVVVLIGAGTFYGVNYISSVAPTTTGSTTSLSTQSSPTIIGSSTTSGQQTTGTGGTVTTRTQTSSVNLPFVLEGQPNVTSTLNSLNATLTVSYKNTGLTTLTINVFVTVTFRNGTIIFDGPIFYPNGPTVAPGSDFTASSGIGPLPAPGAYLVYFYVTSGQNGAAQPAVSLTASRAFSVGT